jgi:hypothetical protein
LEGLLVTWGWSKERLLLGAFSARAETRLAEMARLGAQTNIHCGIVALLKRCN